MFTVRTWAARTSAALLTTALATTGLVAAATAPSAAAAATPATGPGSPSTPYQGWNTYYGLGGDFTAGEVLDVADFLVSSGLADAGYDIVWLDGGWQAEDRKSVV